MSIKNFFIKSDPVVPSAKVERQPIPTFTAGTIPDPTKTIQVDTSSTGEFNQYLMKLMDDANLPGPDYYEFAKALNTMVAMGTSLTEELRYKVTFASFQAQGVTAQSLVDAAAKYIAILSQKKSSEFDASVSSAANTLQNIEKAIEALTKENDELATKMSNNGKKIAQFTADVADKKTKLEIKKTTFEMSYKAFIEKIMSDIENIKKYLLNGNATQ